MILRFIPIFLCSRQFRLRHPLLACLRSSVVVLRGLDLKIGLKNQLLLRSVPASCTQSRISYELDRLTREASCKYFFRSSPSVPSLVFVCLNFDGAVENLLCLALSLRPVLKAVLATSWTGSLERLSTSTGAIGLEATKPTRTKPASPSFQPTTTSKKDHC